MTYCVGLRLDAGLVLLSDTRTNAGIDNVSVYRKMFTFEVPGERAMVLMTAGNLSVTQTVLAKIRHRMANTEASASESILRAESMLEVAEIFGRTLHQVSLEINSKMKAMEQQASASMLLAGQRRGGQPRLFLIYQQGNFIEATDDTPYLQIGEHKYGKPILDRVVTPATSLEDGRKAALLSMDSTLRSNLSVGMPLDLAIIPTNEFRIATHQRIEAGDPTFSQMSEAWSQTLRDGFANMP
ncbi:MAG: peptidase [Rhodobacteraceae bacterium]|nr:peptidase [Paracoccaceae bacterium]